MNTMVKKWNAGSTETASLQPSDTISYGAIITILAALMLFVGAVAYFGLFNQSLRLDEAQSLWQSSHSVKTILYIVAQDVHVPLYEMVLHFWQFAFGNNVTTTRLLSLIFFLLSVPAAYALGKTALGKKAGLITAALVATSPFLNWYGSESRMYSIFTLFTILNQLFFILIFQTKEKKSSKSSLELYWFGYALTALIGMYTHYFYAFVLLTQGVFFLLYRKDFPERSFRNFIYTAFILAAALMPWLYYVKTLGAASNTQPHIPLPTTVNLFNTFSQFLFGFQDDHLNTIIVSLWPLTVLFGFLSLHKRKKIPTEVIYFFMAFLLPIVLAFTISILIKPLFLTRYLILAAPSLYLFIAWMLSTYPKKLANYLTAGLLAIMVITLGIQTFGSTTPVKENFKDVTSFLNSNASPRDIVAISAPFTIYPIEYYYKGPASLITLPTWDRFVVGSIPAFSESELQQDVNRMKSDHDKVYLVLSYDQGYQDKVKSYFDTHFQMVEKQNFSPGLSVYVYKVGYQNISLDEIKSASAKEVKTEIQK